MTKSILLIGEKCIDEYVYGTCERICPEAPAICFKSNGKIKRTAGMVGNVEKNIRVLDPSIRITTIKNPCSIVKRRFVDTKYNSIVFRVDENDKCDPINYDSIEHGIYDAIVFSDYCKGFLQPQDIEYISNKYKDQAVQFIDTKKKIDNFIKHIDFVKINETEYHNNKDCLHFCTNLIVTYGDKGATHYIDNTTYKHYDTEKVEVRDVCGAGDTFLAGLVVKYLETENIQDSINFANNCARIVVSKFGVATP